jgi:hydroxymethylbilane synthase
VTVATLRAATRRSTLARVQTSLVGELLRTAAGGGDAPGELEPVLVDTIGDRRPDAPIWELGRGVFVKEVQAAVLDGRADIAVHSAKDLPSSSPPGLVIAAIPAREDPRDALVGSTLEGLPVGGRVGTGSVRRRAQLAWLRSDLTFGPLRGNMETRLEKAAGFDAIVVAAAALRRLGRAWAMSEALDVELMVPQVGQGALAVECRADDDRVRSILARIDDPMARAAVVAERAYLRELGGGCDMPVGAHATVVASGAAETSVRLTAVLATGDGRIVLRRTEEGTEPEALGRRVARHLLDHAGGAMLVEETSP